MFGDLFVYAASSTRSLTDMASSAAGRALHQFAGARTGRERREIAWVERMEPKPVEGCLDYPAVVRIIPETHNVAFLEGLAVLAVLEGLAVGSTV